MTPRAKPVIETMLAALKEARTITLETADITGMHRPALIHQIDAAIAKAAQALAAPKPQAVAADGWIAGAYFGWNCALTDDPKRFNAEIKRRRDSAPSAAVAEDAVVEALWKKIEPLLDVIEEFMDDADHFELADGSTVDNYARFQSQPRNPRRPQRRRFPVKKAPTKKKWDLWELKEHCVLSSGCHSPLYQCSVCPFRYGNECQKEITEDDKD